MRQAFSALFAVVFGLWAAVATAQSVWVQVEAEPNLAQAQQRARVYAEIFPDVGGFQLNSGWYAITLGPYTEEDAIARIRSLLSRGEIPSDAFLVEGSSYGAQFWPVGADSRSQQAVAAPETTEGQSSTDLGALLSQGGAQTTAPEEGTETASVEPAAEPEVETALVEPEPEPEPVIPEETRREALRSEGRLSRDEKFELQIALQWFGYYDGPIDASFGPGTRGSMAAWQESKDYEQTGVLTTRQRSELLSDYAAVLASLGLATRRDEVAGIELELPLAMVVFDRYDPPFAHYNSINDSGVTVLLISQTGDEASLLGLYDIMQTLEIVPLEGERERRSNRFTLTGANDEIVSHTYAELSDGAVKGFTLIWPTGDEQRRQVVLKAMRDSFSPIEDAVLPEAIGDGALDQSVDLISGLQIRRPERSRSGFYINSRGAVLTTAAAVEGCGRITIDEAYEAEVVARDAELGLALLSPAEALAPIDYARFLAANPRLQSEVAVAGYSFEGMLTAPTLTFGTLADVRGLQGEETVKRLALAASPGDAGGPVFDTTGSVLGMLLPAERTGGKQLPPDVSFAANSMVIAEFLSNSGLSAAASDRSGALSTEDLTRLATNMTVLVSCWN